MSVLIGATSENGAWKLSEDRFNAHHSDVPLNRNAILLKHGSISNDVEISSSPIKYLSTGNERPAFYADTTNNPSGLGGNIGTLETIGNTPNSTITRPNSIFASIPLRNWDSAFNDLPVM